MGERCGVSSNSEVLVFMPAGGVDKATGQPSVASLARIRETVKCWQQLKAAGHTVTVAVSGEETRKSAAGPQCAVLKVELENAGIPWVVDYEAGTMGALERMLDDNPNPQAIYLVCEEPHLQRYTDEIGLSYTADVTGRVQRIEVPKEAAYNDKYPADYVACYEAAARIRLAQRYGRELHPRARLMAEKAAAARRNAIRRVGLMQFVLFGVDRLLNKPTKNPIKRLVIRLLRATLRRDLLGE